MTRPCENCPYRMDAPRRLWHRSEFEGLLEAERSEFGRIYACHKQASLPSRERGFCAGWLLDQKNRGIPYLVLRIELSANAVNVAALEAVNADGLKMFRTVKAMCRANGVRQ
jgi:uncharacterized protein DUF6283